MSNTLKCTNPSCQTFIAVPEGAMQVICPNCNTWHFPSANDEAFGGQQTPDSGSGYNTPPAPNDQLPNYQEQEQPSPIVDPYIPPVARAEQQKPITAPINQNEALAFLLTQSGQRLLLKAGKNIIGRKNSDVIIEDRTVSRRHCVIEVYENENRMVEFLIYDIGHLDGSSSTNGVFISGRSLRLQDYERIPIGAETSIKIGNVHLTLKLMN